MYQTVKNRYHLTHQIDATEHIKFEVYKVRKTELWIAKRTSEHRLDEY